ncbi:neither inactivation nor afterpotential protein C-like [Limulus polyphemus]|uniref:Neither inactivation nor afterpotential protein C-like n=1 Tax=Limulus polyphemus TaxID=6850 RepID=A0ABM1C038_LIMPO|nr:neither inactivation nor afterpotential protein C-like [Limulus polyphemus]
MCSFVKCFNMEYKCISEHLPFETLPDPGDRFEVQELVGTGTYATVYSAIDKQANKKVALKIIGHIAENLLDIETEYRIYKAVNGIQFFPEFRGAFFKRGERESDNEVWLGIEFLEEGTAADLLATHRRFGIHLKEDLIALIIKEVVRAVQYLHENSIIHRDIRAANIMFSKEGYVKLIDFGLSASVKNTNGKAQSSVGSPYWMAPEVISCDCLQEPYNYTCDVWSIGITAIELADTVPSLSDIHALRAMFRINRNPPPSVKRETRWSETLKDFISECLVKNPEYRPCIQEIPQHPFLAQVEGKEDQLRSELVDILKKNPGEKLRNKPYNVTFKNGHLKTISGQPHEKIYVDDLAFLDSPTEEVVLENLEQRYRKGEIYTFAGDVLLTLNPGKVLPLYGDQTAVKYCERGRSDNPPHVFAVADRAYQQMLHHKSPQAVILSGVSGSGKSFCTHQVIRHLAFLGAQNKEGMREKFEYLCPLLDTLGNAYTSTNPNSSHFVKILEITFTKTGKITGAILFTFLLEARRLTDIPKGERNFHVFYYFYEGLRSEGRLKEFGLEEKNYRYLPELKSSNSSEYVKGYQQFLRALTSLAFTEEEIFAIQKVLAAILLLGETEIQNSAAFKLLGAESSELENTLTQDVNARDVYARAMYLRLFSWIVAVVNRQLSFSRLVFGDVYSVTVIDSPGFENGLHNSLHQLCANVISDNLQNYIQQIIFFKELEEYGEEGVNVPFNLEGGVDHRTLVNKLMDSGQGLLTAISKVTQYQRKGESGWMESLQEADSEELVEFSNVNGKPIVSVKHIFRKVSYDATDLVKKNVEDKTRALTSTMQRSCDPRIRAIFSSENPSPFLSSPRRSSIQENMLLPERTVTDSLHSALSSVLNLASTEDPPHLILCMRPQKKELINDYDSKSVQIQLHALNVLETILIRQFGFARRISFVDFLNRYQYLAFDFNENVELTKENCRLLLLRLKMDGWTLGKNKVFLKYYSEEYLSRIYETHIKKIVKVQAIARKYFVKVRQSKTKPH